MGKSSVATKTSTATQDQRSEIGSLASGSQFNAPGSTVAAPGSLAGSVGAYSTLKQSYSSSLTGLTGDQVRTLLLDQEAIANANADRLTKLGTDALAATTSAVKGIAVGSGSLPVTQAGEPISDKWVLGGIVAIGLAIAFAGRRRAAA